MELIENDQADTVQRRIVEDLTRENPFGYNMDTGFG